MRAPARVYLLLLLAAAAALFFFVLLKRERPPERPVLFIAAPQPQVELIPLYLAAARGTFAAAGIEVRFTNVGTGRPLPRGAVLRVCGLEEVIYRALAGQHEKAVLALTQQADAVLLGRRPPFSWSGLKQKTIISPEPTSATTALVETLLRRNGVYPHREAVLLMNLPLPLRIPAFLAGVGDYLVAPEPAATLLWQQKRVFLATPLQFSRPLCLTVIAAPEEWVLPNRAALAAFQQAAAAGAAYLYAHPAAEIAGLVAPYFPHLSLPTLEKVIARGQRMRLWYVTANPGPDRLNSLQELLQQAGELPAPLPYETIFLAPAPPNQKQPRPEQ
ncbi:ABC transporter substrate-binding protein [Thermodesulfitimonas autotrophica]|uniref:ABC transporter substrate-binding protein n=1 Tax=Thermodesulfitimonas autotrophica TaxID=1894989 RepID=UPI002FE216D4